MVCNHSFEDEEPISVSHKGVVTIIYFSEKRGKLDLMSYLTVCISMTPMKKVLVPKKCCRDFTDIKRVFKSYESSSDVEVPCPKRLRSQEFQFNWKDDCMSCGKRALVDPRHPDVIVHAVTTLSLRSKLMECCLKMDDAWGSEVMNCLHGCIDLIAAEAVYHATACQDFCFIKSLVRSKHQQYMEGIVMKKRQNGLNCFVIGLILLLVLKCERSKICIIRWQKFQVDLKFTA